MSDELLAAFGQLKQLYRLGGRKQISLYLKEIREGRKVLRGASIRSIDHILGPKSIVDINSTQDSTKFVVLELAKLINTKPTGAGTEALARLYHSLKEVCELDEGLQSSIREIHGQYTLFRWGQEPKIESGIVLIDLLEGTKIHHFWHKTRQEFPTQDEIFDHQGIAVRIQDRIYFLGLQSQLIRPMIGIFTLEIHQSPIVGIQIAFRYPSLSPMAMKFCMFHSTYIGDISEDAPKKYLQSNEDTRYILHI
jgi:hypothetical protein